MTRRRATRVHCGYPQPPRRAARRRGTVGGKVYRIGFLVAPQNRQYQYDKRLAKATRTRLRRRPERRDRVPICGREVPSGFPTT
jgi:hypothetical protein